MPFPDGTINSSHLARETCSSVNSCPLRTWPPAPPGARSLASVSILVLTGLPLLLPAWPQSQPVQHGLEPIQVIWLG